MEGGEGDLGVYHVAFNGLGLIATGEKPRD